MLETVRSAVRRLSKISNCAFECDYYYYYYYFNLLSLLLLLSLHVWCTMSLSICDYALGCITFGSMLHTHLYVIDMERKLR